MRGETIAPPKDTAYVGAVYEDTTGATGVLAGFGKGARWELLGVGCDGIFVGQSATGGRIRLIDDDGKRYKLVKKGKGDAVKGWWTFNDTNYVAPFNCKHGEAVATGVEQPKCVDCLTYLRLAKEKEQDYKKRARDLWRNAY